MFSLIWLSIKVRNAKFVTNRSPGVFWRNCGFPIILKGTEYFIQSQFPCKVYIRWSNGRIAAIFRISTATNKLLRMWQYLHHSQSIFLSILYSLYTIVLESALYSLTYLFLDQQFLFRDLILIVLIYVYNILQNLLVRRIDLPSMHNLIVWIYCF